MSWLSGIIKAIADALLGYLGDRQDKNKADNAQEELGARRMEAKNHERIEKAAREAMDIRSRPAGTDAELDDGMRAPSDRTKGRPD